MVRRSGVISSRSLTVKTIDGSTVPAVLHGEPADAEGMVVLVHGIFSDKDERGRYIRQADIHLKHGYSVVRFDYRGHGQHPLASEKSTVTGMLLDLKAVFEYAKQSTMRGRFYVVASSFGASLVLLYLESSLASARPERMVFLNPVVDYEATFLHATLPWGKSLFSQEALKQLEKDGFMTMEGDFRMSAEMVWQLSLLKPYEGLKTLKPPTRVIHGDSDTKVPYEVTRRACGGNSNIDFCTIKGADHAFKTPEDEVRSFRLMEEWFYGANRN